MNLGVLFWEVQLAIKGQGRVKDNKIYIEHKNIYEF